MSLTSGELLLCVYPSSLYIFIFIFIFIFVRMPSTYLSCIIHHGNTTPPWSECCRLSLVYADCVAICSVTRVTLAHATAAAAASAGRKKSRLVLLLVPVDDALHVWLVAAPWYVDDQIEGAPAAVRPAGACCV